MGFEHLTTLAVTVNTASLSRMFIMNSAFTLVDKTQTHRLMEEWHESKATIRGRATGRDGMILAKRDTLRMSTKIAAVSKDEDVR